MIVFFSYLGCILYFIFRPYPKKTSALEGYRTIMSFRNSENWVYANKHFYCSARIFFSLALISQVVYKLYVGDNMEAVKLSGALLGIQLLSFLVIMEVILVYRTFFKENK